MSDLVSWNEGALDEGAADLNNAYKAIKAEIEDLIHDLNQNLSSWVGDDQQAYNDAKIAWNQQVEDLNEVLQKMSTAVSEIKANYMATEKKNQSVFLQ